MNAAQNNPEPTGHRPAPARTSVSQPHTAPLARGRTLLLVDDHHVLYRSGTERVLRPARRHSREPVVAQTEPWETAIGWTSVYRHPQTGVYQLWYQAYAGERAWDKRMECVVCYAQSDDGIAFVKPNLGLHPFNDETQTNIVLIGNGGYGDRYCNAVLVDKNEPDPARRYKMTYYDWSADGGREYPGLHVAFSPDGIHWTPHPHGPLNRTSYGRRGLPAPYADEEPYTETPAGERRVRKTWSYPLRMSDAADVFWDPARSAFVIYGKMWLDGPDGTAAWKHGMGRVESPDFFNWSRPQLILTPDDQDAPHVEFHTSPIFTYNGCYFCLNQILNRKAGGEIDIELMTSRDGWAWERPFRQPYFLARSELGLSERGLSQPELFDSQAILTNATPVILDDQIRFYYGAYSHSPVGGVRDKPEQRSGVGLATIPRDRFAGVRPVARSEQATLRQPLENVGQVTFHPLDLGGCSQISLNADATGGSIRVELLTEDGYRLRGYAKGDAVPVQGDALRHPVAWHARRLDELPTGRTILRVHLQHATLFAVS